MLKNRECEVIHIYIQGEDNLISSLIDASSNMQFKITRPVSLRDDTNLTTVIATLGSAGVFTAFFQILTRLLQNNKDRELLIERKGAKIVLKGHSLPEEKELISYIAPELLKKKARN